MRNLNWNEEYYISFILNSKKFSTPIGKGFSVRFEVEDEVKRLRSRGASDVKISIRKWN